MAKVRTLPRNEISRFNTNDASLTELVSLEISEESSPKNDSVLFSDNLINLEKQCFDKSKNDKVTFHRLSENLHFPPHSANTVNSNMMSLGALAKNHLEKDRVSEWHFDGDYSFTDVLSADDRCAFVTNKGCTDSSNNMNLLGICFSTEDNPLNTKTSENDVHNEKLFDFCDVFNFHPVNTVSLDSLGACHILDNSNNGSGSTLEEKVSGSCLFNLGSDESVATDWLDDILFQEKQENVFTKKEASICNGHFPSHSTEKIEQKNESSGEVFPDIDLSFCVKKNVNDKLSVDTSSPDSVDSGFDETELLLKNSDSCLPKKNVLKTGSCSSGEKLRSSPKQSLFSIAISTRPKVDNARLAKLKKIRNELFKNQLDSSVISNQQKYSMMTERTIDHSDECIIMSTFLTIADQ